MALAICTDLYSPSARTVCSVMFTVLLVDCEWKVVPQQGGLFGIVHDVPPLLGLKNPTWVVSGGSYPPKFCRPQVSVSWMVLAWPSVKNTATLTTFWPVETPLSICVFPSVNPPTENVAPPNGMLFTAVVISVFHIVRIVTSTVDVVEKVTKANWSTFSSK